MAAVAEIGAAISPVLVAGVLLLAHDYQRASGLRCPTVEQITEATGVSRSRAYEVRDELLHVLPSVLRPVGRPPSAPREISPDLARMLHAAVATFVMEHSGCISGGAKRRHYSDAFRLYILELREQHPDVELEHFAEGVLLPLGTLKDWLSPAAGRGASNNAQAVGDEPDPPGTVQPSPQIQVVLASWKGWEGTFRDFCRYLRDEQRVSFGPALISNILAGYGKRRPRRRDGRSPDELALRNAFQTFFAGAQWIGDGSPVAVTINSERFVFNLELMVDAHSDGFVGMSIRDQEDSAAVIDALTDGVATTQQHPLALLLDNKPSNHTDDVRAALGDATLPIRATTRRPQNKAHVEGGFGLFRQAAPPLDLRASSPRELAAQVLKLVAQTWARTLNHRPRADRGGRSRVDLYSEHVTPEQINAARAALEERRYKQELARTTASARLDPRVRALLDRAFQRLDLLDPEHHLRLAIARYPLDVIVDALAIFEAKRRLGSLPPGVDARYLLGIVRNLGDQQEGIAIAHELLRARLDARDHMLAPLVDHRDVARSDTPDVRDRVVGFVALALAADRRIDRLFWLLAVADEISRAAKHDPAPLVEAAARRLHLAHRIPYHERQDAVRTIVDHLVPLS